MGMRDRQGRGGYGRQSPQAADDGTVLKEVVTIQNGLACLEASLPAFTGPRPAPGSNGEEDVTAREVCELIEWLCMLLGTNTNAYRLQILIFDSAPRLLPCLLDYGTARVPAEWGSEYERVREMALKALTKVVILCGNTPADSSAELKGVRARMGANCVAALGDSVAQRLMMIVNPAWGHTDVPYGDPQAMMPESGDECRVAAMECLFVLVARVPQGPQAVHHTAIPAIIAHLQLQPRGHPLIQNYECVVLRELAEPYCDELIAYDVSQICISVIRSDPSHDARILCAEIMEKLFRTRPESCRRLPDPIREGLRGALRHRLTREVNGEVLSAIASLMKTWTEVDPSMRDMIPGMVDDVAAKGVWASPPPTLANALSFASPLDKALTIVLHFAEYYVSNNNLKQAPPKPPQKLWIKDKKVIIPPELWDVPKKSKPIRQWGVKDIRNGDLIQFQIPMCELTLGHLDNLHRTASKHATTVEKLLRITPSVEKSRRWFLYDMHHNIVPRTQNLISELRTLVQQRGESQTRDLLLQWEEEGMELGDGHGGEGTLHPGNIVEVTKRLRRLPLGHLTERTLSTSGSSYTDSD